MKEIFNYTHEALRYIPMIIPILLIITKIKYIRYQSVNLTRIILIIISSLEIVYFLILKGDLWFCTPDKVGWIYTIINFFIYLWVLYRQTSLFFEIIEDIKQQVYGYLNISIAIYSYIAAIILFIAFHFLKWNPYYILIGILIMIFIQAIQLKKDNDFRLRLGKKHLNYLIILLLVVPIATFISLLYFIPLLIIAGVIFIILSIMGSSSGKSSSTNSKDPNYCSVKPYGSRTCSTCRHYTHYNEHCNFLLQSVNFEGGCDNHT